MELNKKNNYISGFDLLKFILAILIVAAHTRFLTEFLAVSVYIEAIESAAVPTFFAISSYIFVTQKANLVKTLKRIGILFGIWYLLMLPLTASTFFQVATAKETIYAILLSCTLNGYWFFKALIINTAIVYCCIGTKKRLITCAIIAFAIYTFWSYNNLYHYVSVPFSPYYSFYYHTGYFVLGALMAKFRFLKTSNLILILCLISNLICHVRYPFLAPICRVIYPLLCLPLFFQYTTRNESLYKKMRAMSILFYTMQFTLIYLYDRYLLSDIMQFSCIRFPIILTALVLLSLGILLLERRFPCLKYLH